MKERTQVEIDDVKRMLQRAADRFDAGEKVALSTNSLQGEYDSLFEGVVNGINFVVEAHILGMTGIRRKVSDGNAATLIDSAISDLNAAKVPGVPAASRLKGLNQRRNASAHEGGWLDAIDTETLEAAVIAGRALLAVVRANLRNEGLRV